MTPDLHQANIQVVKQLAESQKLYADMFALQRALNNIIRNAKEAMPTGGKLTISTGKMTDEHNKQFSFIKISDTGHGIPQEKIDTIFDNYQTTKRGGLGLGLAMTKKIIQQHKGTIVVESKINEGTTFIITLPAL